MPKRTDIRKILIIGSGPIIIGQACEFDYSGAQACKALRAEGYEVVLVNSNPATIMTDPDFADRTCIEPLTVDLEEPEPALAPGGAEAAAAVASVSAEMRRAPGPDGNFSSEEVRALRATLDELDECKRLLDGALSED